MTKQDKQHEQQIEFSDDLKYRYLFCQKWSDGESILFIGLNPSMSEGLNPTLKRCIQFAKDWNYGRCYILNLFAYRAAKPSGLKIAELPIGKENNDWLIKTGKRVDKIVFAWGVHGSWKNRDQEVISLFPNAYCLGKTKAGFPKHPLYLKANTPLEPFINTSL